MAEPVKVKHSGELGKKVQWYIYIVARKGANGNEFTLVCRANDTNLVRSEVRASDRQRENERK